MCQQYAAPFLSSTYKHGLVLVLLVMLVYVPVLFFPYLLLDDSWLVRGPKEVPTLPAPPHSVSS